MENIEMDEVVQACCDCVRENSRVRVAHLPTHGFTALGTQALFLCEWAFHSS